MAGSSPGKALQVKFIVSFISGGCNKSSVNLLMKRLVILVSYNFELAFTFIFYIKSDYFSLLNYDKQVEHSAIIP